MPCVWDLLPAALPPRPAGRADTPPQGQGHPTHTVLLQSHLTQGRGGSFQRLHTLLRGELFPPPPHPVTREEGSGSERAQESVCPGSWQEPGPWSECRGPLRPSAPQECSSWARPAFAHGSLMRQGGEQRNNTSSVTTKRTCEMTVCRPESFP